MKITVSDKVLRTTPVLNGEFHRWEGSGQGELRALLLLTVNFTVGEDFGATVAARTADSHP